LFLSIAPNSAEVQQATTRQQIFIVHKNNSLEFNSISLIAYR
jgi:hypothetical protein